MLVDLAAIRARLASLEGFTPGPWRIAHTSGQGGVDAWKVYTDSVGPLPVCVGESNPHRRVFADQRLFAAGPDLHRDLTAALDEIERLRAERTCLLAWLSRIEGVDNPTGDASELRRWAWMAGMGQEVDDG